MSKAAAAAAETQDDILTMSVEQMRAKLLANRERDARNELLGGIIGERQTWRDKTTQEERQTWAISGGPLGWRGIKLKPAAFRALQEALPILREQMEADAIQYGME